MAEAYCADAAQAQVSTLITGIPAVRLELIDLKDPVQVGEETVYEVRVTNQGSAEDLNVNVQGQLPAGLKFIDGHGDTAVQAQGQAIQFGRFSV